MPNVHVVEPKSTSYLEYVELGRIVTPQPVFKKDTIHVRFLQRCLGNPTETFETEKHWEYDVPWPAEEVKVEKAVVGKELVKVKKNWLQRLISKLNKVF